MVNGSVMWPISALLNVNITDISVRFCALLIIAGSLVCISKSSRTMRAEDMTVGLELCNLENLRIFNGYEVSKKERKVIFFALKPFLCSVLL